MRLYNHLLHHSLILLTILVITRISFAQTLDVSTLTTDLEKLLPNDQAGAVIGLINGTEEGISLLATQTLMKQHFLSMVPSPRFLAASCFNN